MAKSKYADRLMEGKPLLDEILDGQTGRLGRAGLEDQESTLVDWVDLAGAEAAVKERYLGRYLFELIQNANDAIIDAQEDSKSISTKHHLVRLELNEQSLLVANYGRPFGQNNVRALCRLHNTTKSASKQIGHKGIGFKSVLEISERPEVYSDVFAFGYDGVQFRRDVQGVMGSDWNPDLALPILRAPYPRYINQLPSTERRRIESLFDDGYVTVIRLPLANPSLVEEVTGYMGEDIKPTLLLFMTAISQIEMCFPDGKEVSFYRVVRPIPETQMNVVVLYRSDNQTDDTDSRWLMLGPIERYLADRSLVVGLEKAWHKVTALRFALAFPLAEDVKNPLLSETSQPFYVYFPTQEFSGLRFAVHGDFYVGDDRKTLALNPLNEWLIDEICTYLASDGIELLKKYWPHSTQLVELLAPGNRPEREFPRTFMQRYLYCLGMAPFVPVEGRHYKSPEDSCLPPEGVDQERLRQLFPATRLRGSAKWAYPIPEVVEIERERDMPFLLSEELGGQVVTPETVMEALKRDGMPPLGNCYDLMSFLADWFDSLPRVERDEFEGLLRTLPIFPTVGGWQEPDSGVIFQANLRPNVDNIATPAGFGFSVIVRSAYPDTGIRSNQYALFRRLGAREYSARALVRDAILPVLTSPEHFETLVAEHPHSVYKAYALLRRYFLDAGTTTDFKDSLTRVPVPATDGKPDGWSGWKSAGDCYLGSDWPGGDVLERLFAGLEDCYFLADIPELKLSDEGTGRREWASFFRWLGVMDHPEVISSESTVARRAKDPFVVSLLWDEYIDMYDDRFKCTNPAKNHGYSRQLGPVHTLSHFADLVRENDAQKLTHLYSLIARHWRSDYRGAARTRLSCYYTTTGCRSEKVDDYLLYQLKHAQWIPAQVDENWTAPLSPRQIWVLGETDPADVRKLVPTLPLELRSGDCQDLAADLGFISSSTAQVEDYVRLLGLLPERYPLEIADLTEGERRRWHRSVRAVFNWTCERIQTGLVSRGDKPTPRPENLQVLAFRGDQPCYVDVRNPALVYPDNNFLAERWKPHCAFLRVNDDWQRIRKWLNVPDLSEVVQSRWSWEGELEAETQYLRERFKQTLPYYLALIKHSQPANYSRLLSRLERLRIHIVKQLSVEETLERLSEVLPISSTERLHLKNTEDPNPRGGSTVRGGDLYATRDVLDNLDLLGDYIADYVEIARLGDAFVILINRDSDDKKQRFVESKGVSPQALRQVFVDLEAEYDERVRPTRSDEALGAVIQKAMYVAKTMITVPTPLDTTSVVDEEEERQQGHVDVKPEEPDTKPKKPSYPALSFDDLPEIVVINPASATAHAPGAPKTGYGGGGYGYGIIVPAEVTEELGRRGEQWAWEAERRRLAKLGLDPDEMEEMEELVWVSRRQPTANYDIKSIRVTEAGEQRDVYIEVKASSGEGRQVKMSRSEFGLALSLGDDYWLYWVANVDAAQPDAPVCYPNLARFLAEKKVDLNVSTIVMTLPEPTQAIPSTGEGEAQ